MSSKEEEQKAEINNEKEGNDYKILPEDYPKYDLSFKIIVIGNSCKYKYMKFIIIINRCGKIMLIH